MSRKETRKDLFVILFSPTDSDIHPPARSGCEAGEWNCLLLDWLARAVNECKSNERPLHQMDIFSWPLCIGESPKKEKRNQGALAKREIIITPIDIEGWGNGTWNHPPQRHYCITKKRKKKSTPTGGERRRKKYTHRVHTEKKWRRSIIHYQRPVRLL